MTDEVLFQGRRFSVVRRRQALPDGTERVHESIQHPGAVVIVPLVGADGVCLIRNDRLAVRATLWELPAGTLEPGEPPLECAARELTEETGYRAGRIEPVCEFFMSPGILNERMHLFLARDLTPGPTQFDDGEAIVAQQVFPWGEALAMCRDGRIQDAKTLVGLLMCRPSTRG